LTYSGFISFGIRIASIGTGIVFTLFITRNLSPEDFGMWRLIGSFIVYVLIFDSITSYWLQRQIARGEKTGGSGFILNSMLSGVGIIVYIIIIFFFTENVSYPINILLLAVILVPLIFLSNTFDSINFGFRPQAVSYGFLGFELIKIPIGFLTIVILDQGISGAIITTIIAYTIKISITGHSARHYILSKINLEQIKKYIRLAWIPLYSNVSSIIFTLDVLVFTLIVGSLEAVAIFAAAQVISGVIGNTNVISQSLTLKLIAEKKSEHVSKILRNVLMLSIPITAGAIIFAKPGLFMLNPQYEIGYMVAIYWSIWAILYVFTEIAYRALQGIESVDSKESSNFRDYVKSKLFLIPTIYNIHYLIYIASLALLLWILVDNEEPIRLLEYWAILHVVLQIPFLIWAWKNLSHEMTVKFPLINFIKYIGIAGITSLVVFLIRDEILIYQREIFVFGPSLVQLLLIGATMYFGLLYLIDNDFRLFMKDVIKEIRK